MKARAFSFVVPFHVRSKKNDVSVRRVGNGVRVTQGEPARAHAHAVRACALAGLAFETGRISQAEFLTVGRMARQRAERSGLCGEATLDRRIAPLASMFADVFGENDVEVEIVEIVGRTKDDDETRVTVRDLGPPPKRKRTGRGHDLVNVDVIVCDALQGVAYCNDRQIIREVKRREFEEDERERKTSATGSAGTPRRRSTERGDDRDRAGHVSGQRAGEPEHAL